MIDNLGSAGSGSGELAALREQVRALTRQVVALADRVAVLEGGRSAGYPDETGSFTLVTQEEPSVGGGVTSGGSVVVEDRADPSNQVQSWTEREAVSGDVGRFLARAVAGDHRGSSGRDRIRQSSKFYIVCKTYSGEVHTNPVRIFTKFSDVKACCSRNGDWGPSVFVGLPSQREVSVCLAAAGFTRPATSSSA